MEQPSMPDRASDRGPTARASVREECSATLEQPLALPGRDDAVEQPLLGPAVVQVVLDDGVAEGLTCDVPRLERRDRLAKRRREPLRIRLVRVALERRRQLEGLLDAVQPGGDQRREREIRVDVAAGYPRLDTLAAAAADDAEAARAVVPTPRERGRRPAPGRIALVRVDVRREEERELLRARDPPREERAEHLVLVREDVRTVAPEAHMHVARAADPRVVGLRHERDRAAVLVRDLLRAVLVDGVVVRHRDRIGVAEVDLVL